MINTGRIITEAYVVNFAGLSGDFNSIHTDRVYAEASSFGQRVVFGLLGLSIVPGLAIRTGRLEGTVIALREIMAWKFSQPIFIDDTIHVEIELKEKEPIPRLGDGTVVLGIRIINQDDQTVMKGRWAL
jgi:acyl dehydratase